MGQCRDSAGRHLGSSLAGSIKNYGDFLKAVLVQQAYCFYLDLIDFVGKKMLKTLQGG